MTEDVGAISNRRQIGKHTALALVLFALMNLANQVDRRAFTTIFPLLKLEWGLSDTQLGLAVSLFTVGRTLITLPAGWLADKKGEIPILQPLVLLWSLMTFLSSRVLSLIPFFSLRFGVSLMDGANGPLDLAYLGKISSNKRRGIVLAVYSTALYLGSALGVIYAGTVGERFGWRWVFLITGIFGLLVSAGFLLLPRIATSLKEEGNLPAPHEKNSFVLKRFISQPLLGIFLGASCGVFSSTALVSWLPTFLTRDFNISLSTAGLITGGLIIPASIIGTLLGGLLSDRLGKKDPTIRFSIAVSGMGFAMVLGITALLFSNLQAVVLLLFFTALCFTLPVSPLLVLVQESVHVKNLATTQAAFGLTTQILGAAPATLVVGMISDFFGIRFGMAAPFLILGVGALIIFLTGRTPLTRLKKM